MLLQDLINAAVDTETWQSSFVAAKPFNHLVIDNFFRPEVANALAADFPEFDSPLWYSYDNAIENKRALNAWDRFPKSTYSVFSLLNSVEFLQLMEKSTGIEGLKPDVGLHGGGWHAHGRGGKLNVHLDYSIHPKLGLERRLNLIVYLTKDWQKEWGGGLQLWSHDEENKQPLACVETVDNKFNRAVLFDTTQNSWHGLPDPINCPNEVIRRSLAIYYLTEPRQESVERPKALFAPHQDQKQDPEVLALIRKRSELNTAKEAYRDKK